MTLSTAFWICMLLWLVFGLYSNWSGISSGNIGPLGNSVLLFILFLLLGWAQFGAPLRG
jgi:hypothetical protein